MDTQKYKGGIQQLKVTLRKLMESQDALGTICNSVAIPNSIRFKLGTFFRRSIVPKYIEVEKTRRDLVESAGSDAAKQKEIEAKFDEYIAQELELHDISIPLSALDKVDISPSMLGTLDWLLVDDSNVCKGDEKLRTVTTGQMKVIK